ncbi:hypothetical protein [Solicola sp. PLA-1-18]|uniref:hypothetical protein n=1 Tax=Solicola sp. PLA-1-18 TaxID=3380532 RepID=UPI003B7A2157
MAQANLRANGGAMDQGGADIQTYRGQAEGFKEEARAQFNTMVANLGDGVGTEQVAAIRAKFEEYLDEHIASTDSQRVGLGNATETMRAGGRKMAAHLGNNA